MPSVGHLITSYNNAPFTWTPKTRSNPGRIRVRPGLTRSHALTVSGSNPCSTRVNNPSSTLVTSRVKPGYKRVKDGGMRTDLERQEDCSFAGQVVGRNNSVTTAREVRNVVPFRAIADELRSQDFERDFKQCREKMKALKKHYKETVDSLRRSGVGVESEDDLEYVHIKFRWFAEIHGVMGKRAAVNPPALMNTSDLHRQRSSTADTVEEEDSLPDPNSPLLHACGSPAA